MKPIFIHSLFRTGSTYVWSKFREQDKYYCYYEPLHQNLAQISDENLDSILSNDFEIVNHPRLKTSYWVEYRPLLEKDITGLPHFRKNFSFDEFCATENNQSLKRYIDFLIKGAGEKCPVLQFNRSSLRIQWFKAGYPGATNIYLVRRQRDQWQSYHELFKRTGFDVFFLQDLLIAGINSSWEPFRPLARHMPIFRFNDDSFDREIKFYRAIYDCYTPEENYLIYYYIWFRALIENVLMADVLVNINRLSSEPGYRQEIYRTLDKHGIDDVKFEDSSIGTYNKYELPLSSLEAVEDKVQRIVLQSLPVEDIEAFFTKLGEDNARYFGYTKKNFLEKREGKSARALSGPQRSKKLETVIARLSRQFSQQLKEIDQLKSVLSWKDHKQKEREQLLQEKEAFIKRIDDEIHIKDDIIQTKEVELKEQIKKIHGIDDLLTKKENELHTHEIKLVEKEEKLKEVDHRLTKKEKELLQLKKELKEKDNRIRELSHQCTVIEKEVLNMQKEQAETEKKLHQKDRQLAQKEKDMLNLQLTLKDQDEQINSLSFQVHEHLDTINQIKAALNQTDANLSQLEIAHNKLLKSYTFRIGSCITAPAKFVKRAINKSAREKDHYKPTPAKSGQFADPLTDTRPIALPALDKSNIPGIKDLDLHKKVNLTGELDANFGKHRSGWSYVVKNLDVLHNPGGMIFDTFVERTFFWHPKGVKPHREPWIGIIHVPPKVPQWFHYEQANDMLFQLPEWKESIGNCKGLFTLSRYHKKSLEKKLDVPIENLYFATEFVRDKWNSNLFLAAKKRKIVQIGWWLRKLHAIYQLPPSEYEKIFLNAGHKSIDILMKKERKILIKEGTFNDAMYDSAKTLSFLSNKDYDKLLCENIAFTYLYDASANNTVIECIGRNTPLLVNPLEPVEEYLGKDYPFYYNSLDEAIEKARDVDLVLKTHRYLVNLPIKKKLTIEYFIKSLTKSKIFNSLQVPEPMEPNPPVPTDTGKPE